MKKDIFDELYYGEVFPSETVVLPSIAKEASAIYDMTYNELYDMLNKEQRVVLERLLDEYSILENFMSKEYYKTGFVTGLRIFKDFMILDDKQKLDRLDSSLYRKSKSVYNYKLRNSSIISF